MSDPVIDFYSAKEADADTACRELIRLIDEEGKSGLLPALETAQDTLAHWRKLRIAFERDARA